MQGTIQEEKFDSFNIPQYTPSPFEVESQVKKEAIIDEVFSRYGEIVASRMSKEKTEFVNVTVSVTRKG